MVNISPDLLMWTASLGPGVLTHSHVNKPTSLKHNWVKTSTRGCGFIDMAVGVASSLIYGNIGWVLNIFAPVEAGGSWESLQWTTKGRWWNGKQAQWQISLSCISVGNQLGGGFWLEVNRWLIISLKIRFIWLLIIKIHLFILKFVSISLKTKYMIVGFGTSNTSGDTLCPKQFAIRRLLALLEIACESGDAYFSKGYRWRLFLMSIGIGHSAYCPRSCWSWLIAIIVP